MVPGVGQVDVADLLAGGLDDRRRVVTLVERVRGAVQEADPVPIQAADHVHRLEPVLDEVVRVRLDDQLHTLALEDRQQLVHRLQELGLGGLRRLWPSVELGVDHLDAEIDSDLDGPLPRAHGRLPLVLVGTGPAQHRQHRRDPDAGVRATFFSLLTPASSTRGYLKNGMKSALGDSSIQS